MAHNINLLHNILVQRLNGTLMGPVVASQMYDEQTLTHMDVFEWEVANGTTLERPLPFGMFADVVKGNINKAKLVVRTAPGFFNTPSAPAFAEVCGEEKTIDPNIKSAIVCRQVVPVGTAADAGSNIWESVVRPIDAVHALKITTKNVVYFEDREFLVMRDDVVPSKFRGVRTMEESSELVPGTASLPVLGTNDEMRGEDQITPATKRVTRRQFTQGLSAQLLGDRNYVERAQAETEDLLSEAEPVVDAGLMVIESVVTQYRDELYSKETLRAKSWPLLKGSERNEELDVSVGYTEQMVEPPAVTTADKNTEYVPQNEHRSLKRVIDVPTQALESYMNSFPVRVNLQLPQVLKGVTVVWNVANENGGQDSGFQGVSTGESYSLSANLADVASGGAAAIPELVIDIEEIWGTNLPATGKFFYLKLPITEADILNKVGAQRWPVFKPKRHTIVGVGQKVGCSVRVSVNASASGSTTNYSRDAGWTASENKDISLTNNVVNLPPTIHGQISIADTARTVTAQAEAQIAVSGTNFPAATAQRSVTLNANAYVYPTSLAPTSGPTEIPSSGIYLIDSRIEPYKWGYAKVYAEIFDASILA